jgi:Smg protein
MKENVLDVLTYMFESHLYDEVDAHINRESLQAELVEIGFDHSEVEKAFDWLAALPSSHEELSIVSPQAGTTRIFNPMELKKLDEHCRGYLIDLEQMGVLNPISRELVIDRVIALETDEINIEQLRWICLIVLYNLSESDLSYSWLEDMVMEFNSTQVH